MLSLVGMDEGKVSQGLNERELLVLEYSLQSGYFDRIWKTIENS
jgi:hypothetical protein